ncbi:uncharacterized protein LOC134263889 [Saccostrea cucullata]|uniref:uncharacterized protein LOC134263889 n=1 Tax=Saccostrea cuccullata TaxID=36930 RepID=UPI002ED61D96
MGVGSSKHNSPDFHLTMNEMCKSHSQPLDIICEDCDKCICAMCTKAQNHTWKTTTTILEDMHNYLNGIEKEVKKISKKISENETLYSSEYRKLQKHFEEIITLLTKEKRHHEQRLKDNTEEKNDRLIRQRSELGMKKRKVLDTMKSMEDNIRNKSYVSLIENKRKFTIISSDLEVHMTNCEQSVRFIKGAININLIKSLLGRTLDLDDVGLVKINSFQYGKNVLSILKTFNEDHCYLREDNSEYTEQINMEGAKSQKISISPNDFCVTETGDIFFTGPTSKSVCYLSPSSSPAEPLSTVISTDRLVPWGICQSLDGGLLVTFRDKESELYNLDEHSRRLVRHITVTGDVIHEYEYQEDGHTRLFTWPYRVTQNSNTDICVVNRSRSTAGDLRIISLSGGMKSVYQGENVTKILNPADVVCDSLCNILVTDINNRQIHLLSSNGEYLKSLLTDNEENRPHSLSLHNSTLWVGYYEGSVTVFQYSM